MAGRIDFPLPLDYGCLLRLLVTRISGRLFTNIALPLNVPINVNNEPVNPVTRDANPAHAIHVTTITLYHAFLPRYLLEAVQAYSRQKMVLRLNLLSVHIRGVSKK